MWHGSNKKCGGAAFLYLSHSAVVIPGESARHASDAGNRERRERPPPNRGGHVTLSRGMLRHTSTRPHGVALVLIYPCGKAWNRPPFPSRFIVSNRSSPSRVRFAASRPGRLRADPKDALLTRGKGGCGFGPCGRAERNLSVIPGRLEPQPRGAVTRRAVAQRRTRAGGLTRPLAEAIRGFGVVFVAGSACPFRRCFP